MRFCPFFKTLTKQNVLCDFVISVKDKRHFIKNVQEKIGCNKIVLIGD